MRITRMTNSSPAFYATLGPYLSRREIVSELGAPVWDDDGKVWFVARKGKTVLGFAALRENGKRTALVSAYVLPEYRRSGVYSALIDARLESSSGLVTATATIASAKALLSRGFSRVGKRGRFTLLEKDYG